MQNVCGGSCSFVVPWDSNEAGWSACPVRVYPVRGWFMHKSPSNSLGPVHIYLPQGRNFWGRTGENATYAYGQESREWWRLGIVSAQIEIDENLRLPAIQWRMILPLLQWGVFPLGPKILSRELERCRIRRWNTGGWGQKETRKSGQRESSWHVHCVHFGNLAHIEIWKWLQPDYM